MYEDLVGREARFSDFGPGIGANVVWKLPQESGARYLGVYKEVGFGPADRGLPLIPIERRGDKIAGRMKDPAWYRYLDYVERL